MTPNVAFYLPPGQATLGVTPLYPLLGGEDGAVGDALQAQLPRVRPLQVRPQLFTLGG